MQPFDPSGLRGPRNADCMELLCVPSASSRASIHDRFPEWRHFWLYPLCFLRLWTVLLVFRGAGWVMGCLHSLLFQADKNAIRQLRHGHADHGLHPSAAQRPFESEKMGLFSFQSFSGSHSKADVSFGKYDGSHIVAVLFGITTSPNPSLIAQQEKLGEVVTGWPFLESRQRSNLSSFNMTGRNFWSVCGAWNCALSLNQNRKRVGIVRELDLPDKADPRLKENRYMRN